MNNDDSHRVAIGLIGLIFLDPGVKANEADYGDLILSQRLLPGIRRIFGEFI